MTTHEPTVHRIQEDPACWPTYRIEWPNGEPKPGDLVLMSAELFEQSIEILSGICHACQARQQSRDPEPGTCVSCPNRDPAVTGVVNCATCGKPDHVHGPSQWCHFVSPA